MIYDSAYFAKEHSALMAIISFHYFLFISKKYIYYLGPRLSKKFISLPVNFFADTLAWIRMTPQWFGRLSLD